MNEIVFRAVLPAFLVVSLAAVSVMRRRILSRTGRGAVHTGLSRGADSPAEFAAAVLVFASAVLVADILLRALWPQATEVALTLPALGAWTALRWGGLALISGGVSLYVLGLVTMGSSWRIGIDTDRPGPLVTRGVFGFVRHPLYCGILAAALGMAMLTADVLAIAATAAIWTTVPLQARLEEEFLVGRHPEYADYRARTGRFLPVWRVAPARQGSPAR